MNALMRGLLLALIAVMIAACGTLAPEPTPTLQGATEIPDATPLPSVATAIPAGLPDNPLQLAILPQDAEAAEELVTQLEAFILNATNVTVDVVLVDTYAEALAAVCSSDEGTVSAAFLGGLTTIAAEAQGCATAQLQQVVDGDTGGAGVILVDSTLGVNSIAVLEGRTFCRVSIADTYSWQLPLLVLRSEGFDTSTIGEVVDYDDYEAILEAIVAGECTGTAMPQSVWEDLESDYTDNVRQVASSVELPFLTLVLPFETPLAARLSLTDGLLDIGSPEVPLVEETPEVTAEADTDSDNSGNEDDADAAETTPEATEEVETVPLLPPFFGEDTEFERVGENAFDELRDFLDSTGLDFSQLGQ